MVAKMEGVKGYAAGVEHSYHTEKTLFQAEGREKKEHIATTMCIAKGLAEHYNVKSGRVMIFH